MLLCHTQINTAGPLHQSHTGDNVITNHTDGRRNPGLTAASRVAHSRRRRASVVQVDSTTSKTSLNYSAVVLRGVRKRRLLGRIAAQSPAEPLGSELDSHHTRPRPAHTQRSHLEKGIEQKQPADTAATDLSYRVSQCEGPTGFKV